MQNCYCMVVLDITPRQYLNLIMEKIIMIFDKKLIDLFVEFGEICQSLDYLNKLIIDEKPNGKPFLELKSRLTVDEIIEFVAFIKFGLYDFTWESARQAAEEVYDVKYYFDDLKDYSLAAKRIENGYKKRGTCGEILTHEEINSFILSAKRAQTYMQLRFEFDRIEDDWIDSRLIIDRFDDHEKDQLVTLMNSINNDFDWFTLIHSKAATAGCANKIEFIYGYTSTILPDEAAKLRNEKFLLGLKEIQELANSN